MFCHLSKVVDMFNSMIEFYRAASNEFADNEYIDNLNVENSRLHFK